MYPPDVQSRRRMGSCRQRRESVCERPDSQSGDPTRVQVGDCYREEQKLLWQAALADVLARHPLDGSASSKEVQDYEVEELRKRWAARAQMRPWPIWSRS